MKTVAAPSGSPAVTAASRLGGCGVLARLLNGAVAGAADDDGSCFEDASAGAGSGLADQNRRTQSATSHAEPTYTAATSGDLGRTRTRHLSDGGSSVLVVARTAAKTSGSERW